jgi:hypothetical protein
MIDLVEYNIFVRNTFTDVRDFRISKDSFSVGKITALAVEFQDAKRDAKRVWWRRCMTYKPLSGRVGFFGLEVRGYYLSLFHPEERCLRLSNFETTYETLDELKNAVKMAFDVRNNFEHTLRKEKIRSAAEGYEV